MTQLTIAFREHQTPEQRREARRVKTAGAKRCGLDPIHAECVGVLRRYDWRTSHEVASLSGMRPIDPRKPDGYWGCLPHTKVLKALDALVARGFVSAETEAFSIDRFRLTRLGRLYAKRFDLMGPMACGERIAREGKAVL